MLCLMEGQGEMPSVQCLGHLPPQMGRMRQLWQGTSPAGGGWFQSGEGGAVGGVGAGVRAAVRR